MTADLLEAAGVSCSVELALYHADWLLRYALDMIESGDAGGRAYHPGVRSHATGAHVQVLAATACARFADDQPPV